MNKYAIIVAGGSGTRMGSKMPKQFLILQNKPVVWHSIHAFFEAFDDIHIILVLPAEHIEGGKAILESFPNKEQITVTTGGVSRFESVKKGLFHVPVKAIVFIHDGVRCLVTADLIRRCYDTAVLQGNAIPATHAVDTLRLETSSGNEILDRSRVRIVQTPQTFLSDIIKNACDREYHESFTDDASVIESCGHRIHLVEGEITNLKITTQTDLLIADKILENRLEIKGRPEISATIDAAKPPHSK